MRSLRPDMTGTDTQHTCDDREANNFGIVWSNGRSLSMSFTAVPIEIVTAETVCVVASQCLLLLTKSDTDTVGISQASRRTTGRADFRLT